MLPVRRGHVQQPVFLFLKAKKGCRLYSDSSYSLRAMTKIKKAEIQVTHLLALVVAAAAESQGRTAVLWGISITNGCGPDHDFVL